MGLRSDVPFIIQYRQLDATIATRLFFPAVAHLPEPKTVLFMDVVISHFGNLL